MFGKLKGMMKLTEAGQIIEEAFRRTTTPFGNDFDEKALAIRLTALLYNSKPELFDGKMGKPPHPVVTAAVALASGLAQRPEGFDEEIDLPMFLALGSLLQNVSANSQAYGLGGYDVPMLKKAEQIYWEHEAKTRDATDKIVGSLGL